LPKPETEAAPPPGWLVLIYRVPPEPSRNRVSVWRELKRHGALFLQNCACVFPDLAPCRKGLRAAIRKVEAAGGSHYLFPVERLPAAQSARLIAAFRQLSTKEYEEIIEECRTRFAEEVASERERKNFTYEEAEEIREDFEKIERWYRRVVARDWFHAGLRERVADEIKRCEALLDAFEEEVYARAGADQGVHEAP